MFWSFTNTVACILSSYFYMYIAAFGIPGDGTSLKKVEWAFEVVFIISFLLEFNVDYTTPDTHKSVKNHALIAQNYLRGSFLMDLLPLVPLKDIFDFGGKERLLYFVKMLRLVRGYRFLNVAKIMESIKSKMEETREQIVSKQDEIQKLEMTMEDQNKIHVQISINFLLRFLRVAAIILNICFFLGHIFYIYQDLSSEFEWHLGGQEWYYFSNLYGFEDRTNQEMSVIMVYFSTTTLSTVGFGDFAPRSNSERVFSCFVLIFGVAIFSIMMDLFKDIVASLQ